VGNSWRKNGHLKKSIKMKNKLEMAVTKIKGNP
jgi:hypothetical protein